MRNRPFRRRSLISAALTATALGATFAVPPPVSAATGTLSPRQGSPGQARPPDRSQLSDSSAPSLPGPPRPPSGRPRMSRSPRVTANTSPARTGMTAASSTSPGNLAAAAVTPGTARTFGPSGPARTLVLYDSTGDWGWLGELYALAGGTLATHFGSVTAEPATSYMAGQVDDYDATIYLGSTYNEALPADLLTDVTTTTTPVIWSGFNIWQLSGESGSAANAAFQAKYGWDPATSYLDTTDTLATVTYKGQNLDRSTHTTGGLLSPHITNASGVTQLAQANCTDDSGSSTNCAPIAQVSGSTIPWAIRSANLTYVGEIPFSYLSESDRYLAFADLLFPALSPTATASKQALVRLEDVNPTTDPTQLRQVVDYLYGQGVPFQIGVIPQYSDPLGAENDGVPLTVTLTQRPALVSELQYAQTHGGTVVQHGYTHQYSNVANPYNGVSGDDFEFYRARCSATQSPPYEFQPCTETSWVIQEGPLPDDSASRASGRVLSGRTALAQAGLGTPAIFETPHYAASAADYQGIRTHFATRYERELFFGGLLGGPGNASQVFGQFFPYRVSDIYGGTVLPENLGNYEPVPYNNHPARTAADVVANARANQVMTHSVASFFFHPIYPLSELQSIVTGIKGLGYTFVPASQVG